jgi:hypothetical protein
MKNGEWKWAIMAGLFFAIPLAGFALSGAWRWATLAALGVYGVLMIVVWHVNRSGALPDDGDARTGYEHDMHRHPGESPLRVWFRRFLWHL